MKLTPIRPPGRINCKARAFEAEIARLRSEGYTCEAIREALADVGVIVSLSTVQREAARYSKRQPLAELRGANLVPPVDGPALAAAPTSASLGLTADARTGKEIAASFVRNRITNPLFRARSTNESRGH